MLKTKLTSEPADNLKGAYVQKGEEWVLDILADDHPKMLENKTLIQEKQVIENKVSSLEADKANAERERDDAKSKALPHGHYAVKKEVKDAGEASIAAGFNAETVKTAGEKITAFENEKTQVAEQANKTKAFQFAGVKDVEAAMDLKAADNLKIEWKTVDGAEKPYLVGEKDGQKTETLFDKKFVEAADGFKAHVGTLYAEPKKGFEFSRETDGGGDKNEFDQIRENTRNELKFVAPTDTASVLGALSGHAPAK